MVNPGDSYRKWLLNPFVWYLRSTEGYKMSAMKEKITHLMLVGDLKTFQKSEQKLIPDYMETTHIEIMQQLLPTYVYQKERLNKPDLPVICRACNSSEENLYHVMCNCACPWLAQDLYKSRHDDLLIGLYSFTGPRTQVAGPQDYRPRLKWCLSENKQVVFHHITCHFCTAAR